MSSSGLTRAAALLAIAYVAASGASAASVPSVKPGATTVAAWSRWETTLSASNAYRNPYANVLLRVSWSCLANCADASAGWGAQLPAYGFWNGGNELTIRARFPQPRRGANHAVWRWTTSCVSARRGDDAGCRSDAGLHRSGIVTVKRSTPDKLSGGPLFPVVADADVPLIEAGQFARASPYLATLRGPFFWQGDTAWAASMRARLDLQAPVASPCTAADWAVNDWKCYVDDRAAKGFTVVQIAVPQYWMGQPFVDANGRAPFVDSTDLPGWSKWDPEFWQSFEEKVRYANDRGLVVLVVGVMEPSYQHLDDPVPNALRYPDAAQARTFARNLAALLAGDSVILSPGFDTSPSDPERARLIRLVGHELKATVPGILVTNHLGGRTPTAAAGEHNDYLDFCGEPWLDFVLLQSGQARSLRASDPEGQLQAITKQARQLPADLRSSGCRKPLINAEAVYDFEGAALREGKRPPEWWSNYSQYRVRQTGYLTRLSGAAGYSLGVFGLADWGLGDASFSPRAPQAAIAATSADDVRRMGTLLQSTRWDWLAPVALESDPAEAGDHLRVVMARDVGRRTTLVYMPDNAQVRLRLNAALYPDFMTSRWLKTFFDPRTDGKAYAVVPKLVPGANDTYEFARPESCENGQSGDCDWVLELAETSWERGDQLEAWMDASNGETLDPAIAVDAAGESLVAWTSYSPSDETVDIALQRFSSTGERLGAAVVVSGREAGVNRRSPRVAIGPDGKIVVAWQEYAPAKPEWSIVARELDGRGAPMRPLIAIAKSGDEYLALERLEIGDRGYQVTWQQLVDGHSQGHYRSDVDRGTGSPTRPVLVASATD